MTGLDALVYGIRMITTMLEVTFYDEQGALHVGELVNAATITSNNGQYVAAEIDREHADEIVVLTVDADRELQVHNVLIGNVRHFRPLILR